MPKVLFINGYSFFFFSNEGNEPIHVHVKKGDAIAKFWLKPEVEIDYSEDFSPRELRFMYETLVVNRDALIQKWNEYFS